MELELMNYVTSLDLGLFHLTNADFGEHLIGSSVDSGQD
jgi:hypothetical protein